MAREGRKEEKEERRGERVKCVHARKLAIALFWCLRAGTVREGRRTGIKSKDSWPVFAYCMCHCGSVRRERERRRRKSKRLVPCVPLSRPGRGKSDKSEQKETERVKAYQGTAFSGRLAPLSLSFLPIFSPPLSSQLLVDPTHPAQTLRLTSRPLLLLLRLPPLLLEFTVIRTQSCVSFAALYSCPLTSLSRRSPREHTQCPSRRLAVRDTQRESSIESG